MSTETQPADVTAVFHATVVGVNRERFGGDGYHNTLEAPLMPPWWDPEHRFAWALDRKTGNKREAFADSGDEGLKALSRIACHVRYGLPRGLKRITASLEDGSEVPA